MAVVNYGQDTACTTDLPLRDTQVTGYTLLANAVIRRITTPRGALAVINSDPNYGINIYAMVNAEQTPATISLWQSQIRQEIEKDERIASASVSISFVAATQSATILITIIPSQGPSFKLILAVGTATAELVSVTTV